MVPVGWRAVARHSTATIITTTAAAAVVIIRIVTVIVLVIIVVILVIYLVNVIPIRVFMRCGSHIQPRTFG